ncbi:MAG: glutathione S-transferase [Alcanivoracaceae bacterium]|nr:glutathione S-transferase [Alcanivoracaceae bacterium]
MSEKYLPDKNKQILYGAEFSLYSGKIRSYLRKKGIPYIERLSDLKTYKNFILPRTGVKFIPVVQTPDNIVIQDTTEIIDRLEQKFTQNSIYPITPKQKLTALLLEVYGDEWLLIPAMHYRWNFPKENIAFIYQEFGRTLYPRCPRFIQKIKGKKLGKKFKAFVPKLGITQNSIPAIESSYLQLLRDLNNHFKKHKYLLGNSPSIGDFGLIAPLYAHLYRDLYPRNIMKKTAPRVLFWVERMMANKPFSGNFLPDDEVPESINLILKRMANEQIPVLLDTSKVLDNWYEKNPNNDIPRMIGKHIFTLDGVEENRAVFPYSLWMWQRPYDYYHTLTEEQKLLLKYWLEEVGLYDALNKPINTRLKRFNNYLLIENFL